MSEATDLQMQMFMDNRVRVRAEQLRAVLAAVRDDKAAIDDEYARAAGTNRWTDNRTDGPPHLLVAGNSADPDDLLNYNAFATALLEFFDTTQAGAWAILQRACVRGV
jgi:hypothetical protein